MKVSDNGTSFTPAPQGLHHAVCVDVVDLGMMESKFTPGKPKHKLRIVWELEDANPETGKPFLVGQMYTASLNEKATLRAHLESWRGRKFSAEELKGFEMENLLGVNCQLTVVHASREDKVYANVQSVVPLAKGMGKRAMSGEYVRVKDRDPNATNGNGHSDADDSGAVPF